MWQRNEFASNGVREFAEKSEAWTLMKEVETAGERIQSVYGILSAPAVVGGTGQMDTEFEVFARHSLVSLSTTGSFQCRSGHWVQEDLSNGSTIDILEVTGLSLLKVSFSSGTVKLLLLIKEKVAENLQTNRNNKTTDNQKLV